MANVIKQVAQEVQRYKTKFIAPEVLAEMNPKFRLDYINAIEEYRKTDQYKKNLAWHAKHAVNAATSDYFNDDRFRKRIYKVIEKHVLKEIVDGDK